MKKLQVWFLLLVMSCVLMLCASATTSGTCGTSLTWNFDSATGALTISGTGAMTNTWGSSAKTPWNAVKAEIKTLSVEEGVTSIGKYAFGGCTALADIELPSTLTTIYSYAFDGCTALQSVAFANGTQNINAYAFKNCTALAQVYIPPSVTSLSSAFSGCTALKRIEISDLDAWCSISMDAYSSIFQLGEGALYLNGSLVTEVTLPSGITTVTSSLPFAYCTGLEKIIVPEGVTTLDYAIQYCPDLETLILPSTLQSIYGYSLYQCPSLQAVVVAEGNPNFYSEDGVLFFVNSGKNILWKYPQGKTDSAYVVPEGVQSIYAEAFQNNPFLSSVCISHGVTTISADAFSGCTSLSDVKLSDGLEKIYSNVFSSCPIEELFIPATVQRVDSLGVSPTICGYEDTYAQQYAIAWNLPFVSLGEAPFVTASGSLGDTLRWKLIDDHLLRILGSGAMPTYSASSETPWYPYMDDVTTIIVDEGVTAVGENCFSYAPKLTRAVLPQTLTSIAETAFDISAVSLRLYGFAENATADYANTHAFSFVPILAYGKAGVTMTWIVSTEYTLSLLGSGEMFSWNSSSAVPWYSYKTSITDIEMEDGILNVGDWAFSGCSALKTLVIPDSVEYVQDYALNGCSSLEELTLPFIGRQRGEEGNQGAVFGSIFGFLGVSGDAGISSDGITQRYTEQLDKGTFSKFFVPSSLKKVTVTDESFIPYGAFYNCQFEEITIPAQITHISPYAFYNCSATVNYLGTKSAWQRLEIGKNNDISVNIIGSRLTTDAPTFLVTDSLGGKQVEIASADGTHVYYTVDGSEPTCKSERYSAPILLTTAGTHTVKAIAALPGHDASSVITVLVDIEMLPAPKASLESGLVAKGTSVSFSCPVDGAKIYYTVDQTEPDMESTLYTSSITVNGFVWVKAIAVLHGYASSAVSTYNFTDEYAQPIVTTNAASLVSKHSVLLEGTVENADVLGFYETSFVYYKKDVPEEQFVVTADGDFSAVVEDLAEDTEYCYFARVINGDAVGEGAAVSFKTKTHEIPLSVELHRTGVRVPIGRDYTLKAIVAPSTALDQTLAWTSSDETVAVVDQNGKVKTLAEGTATITATAKASGVSGSCRIVVFEKYVTGEQDFSELNVVTNTQNYAQFGFSIPDDVTAGDNYYTLAYLARWDGVITEENDQNLASYANKDYGYQLEDYYIEADADYHVQNVYILPVRKDSLDNDEIKAAIMKYGAVTVGMMFEVSALAGENNENHYYSAPWSWSNGNHMVTVVGWDDNYPAENFKTMPAGDGAFIVKNSWGGSFGESGFFYVSYYDTFFAKFSMSYVYPELETNNNYNNIWQYDYTGPSYKLGYTGAVYAANVFPQDGKVLANDELLKAVSFHTAAQDMGYEIYVIEDYKSSEALAIDAAPVKTGKLHEMGYHTIELDEDILLKAGTHFGVIVKLISADVTKKANFLVEKRWDYGLNKKTYLNVGFYSADGVNWSEVDSETNVCLKAFTDFANLEKAETGIYRANEVIEGDSIATEIQNAEASYSLTPYRIVGLYTDMVDTNLSNYVSKTELPAKYDLRSLRQTTPARDQGGFGICWSFAAMASLESCIMKRETEGSLYELSQPILGDLNGDGVLTVVDALLSLKALLNDEDTVPDMNGDGRGSLVDILKILKAIA